MAGVPHQHGHAVLFDAIEVCCALFVMLDVGVSKARSVGRIASDP
jgi:hypothetical protein